MKKKYNIEKKLKQKIVHQSIKMPPPLWVHYARKAEADDRSIHYLILKTLEKNKPIS
jgi:hypothetical protein